MLWLVDLNNDAIAIATAMWRKTLSIACLETTTLTAFATVCRDLYLIGDSWSLKKLDSLIPSRDASVSSKESQ